MEKSSSARESSPCRARHGPQEALLNYEGRRREPLAPCQPICCTPTGTFLIGTANGPGVCKTRRRRAIHFLKLPTRGSGAGEPGCHLTGDLPHRRCPPPPTGAHNGENVRISRRIRPLPPIAVGGRRGVAVRRSQTPAFFWPSANSLPWREGGGADPRISCVCVGRAMQSILNESGRPNHRAPLRCQNSGLDSQLRRPAA
jgi:hypothetical protein